VTLTPGSTKCIAVHPIADSERETITDWLQLETVLSKWNARTSVLWKLASIGTGVPADARTQSFCMFLGI